MTTWGWIVNAMLLVLSSVVHGTRHSLKGKNRSGFERAKPFVSAWRGSANLWNWAFGQRCPSRLAFFFFSSSFFFTDQKGGGGGGGSSSQQLFFEPRDYPLPLALFPASSSIAFSQPGGSVRECLCPHPLYPLPPSPWARSHPSLSVRQHLVIIQDAVCGARLQHRRHREMEEVRTISTGI